MAHRQKPLNERAWVRQVMTEHEAIMQHQPFGALQIEELPAWVCRGLIPLMSISHPKLMRIPLRKWTARNLGYFLGRQSALDSTMRGEVPLSQEVWQETEKALEAHLQLLGWSPSVWAKKVKQHSAGLLKWRERYKKFVSKVIIAARARPYVESAAFAKGYGEGNAVSSTNFESREIEINHRIAWVFLLFWRQIEEFESVGQMHRFLAGAAKPMGIQIALKRVEKLCQRIGLRFRGRGRPKKNPPGRTSRS